MFKPAFLSYPARSGRAAAVLAALALAVTFAGPSPAIAADLMRVARPTPLPAAHIDPSVQAELAGGAPTTALVVYRMTAVADTNVTDAAADALSVDAPDPFASPADDTSDDMPATPDAPAETVGPADTVAPAETVEPAASEADSSATAQGNTVGGFHATYDVWLSARSEALAAIKLAVVTATVTDAAVVQDFDQLPIQLVRFESLESLIAVAQHPLVAGVYENKVSVPTLAQSLPLVSAPAAQAAGFTGAGRSVAVLDTGADYTRAAFGPCRTPGVPTTTGGTCRVTVARDFAPNDSSLDDNGHGTNVSGVVLGVAPQANVLALDVFQWYTDLGGVQRFGSFESAQIAALNWVIANRATHGIAAVNMSLGDTGHNTASCPTSALTTVFDNVRRAGVLPVVAAGNDAVVGGVFQNGVASPACVPGAVSVGAVYDANIGRQAWRNCTDAATAADQIACFSQTSANLSILAPGATITAAGSTMSGTSQAAPHVAGAVAALAGRCQVVTPVDILGALVGSGPSVTDPRTGVSKRRLDVVAAGNYLCPFGLAAPRLNSSRVGGSKFPPKVVLRWNDLPIETSYQLRSRRPSMGDPWTSRNLGANITTVTEPFSGRDYMVRGCVAAGCGRWSSIVR